MIRFFSLLGNRLFCWYCVSPYHYFLQLIQVVLAPASRSYSHTCRDHYLPEYFRGATVDLQSSLCSFLFRSALPVNSSCLGFPRLLALSPRLLETTKLHLTSRYWCRSPETFSRKQAGALIKLTLVFPVSGGTVLLCLLYSVLSGGVSCILFSFFGV